MVAQFKRKAYSGGSESVNNLPPQNIEAEESVLGGILLDPEAMPRVLSVRLEPKEFYIPAHKDIFQIAYDLFREGLPTDLMTVTSRLYDHGMLSKIGGQSKLAQLVDRTVSAVNCDKYAMLIKEKFARRQIILAANAMAQEAYDGHRPLEEVMGAIEQRTAELSSLPVERKADQFLEWQCNQVISRVRDLEMSADLPAVKIIKKQRLADEFGFRGVKILDEIYMSSLTAEEYEPAMTLDELEAKYSHDDAPDWLMHGIIPSASVILLHALGGDGKTLLSYYLSSLLGKGDSWGEFTPTAKKRRVLIVQVDEPAKNLITRARQLNLGDLEIKYITRWQVEGIPRLVSEIDSFKPDLVMIDSITGASKFSVYSENDVPFAKPLLLMRDIAQQKNVTFLVIHHSSKGVDGKGGGARGTSALENSVSELWRLSRVNPSDEEDTRRIFTIRKSRTRRQANYLITLGNDGDWGILGRWDGQHVKDEEDAPAREKTIEFLKKHPNINYEVKDLSEELLIGDKTLEAVLLSLRSDGLIGYIPGKRGRGGYPQKYCFKMLINSDNSINSINSPENIGKNIDHAQQGFPISPNSLNKNQEKIVQFPQKTSEGIREYSDNPLDPYPASVTFPKENRGINLGNIEKSEIISEPEPQPEIQPPDKKRIEELIGKNQKQYEYSIKFASLEELDTALQRMRSTNSTRAQQIKARIEEIVTVQPTLLT